MHVVCVTHAYPRFDGDVAGAFIERLNVALGERKHLVKVVVPSDRGVAEASRRHSIAIGRVRYAPRNAERLAYTGQMREHARSPLGSLWLGNLILAQAREIRHLHQIQPVDIVHAHWWVPGGMSAWIARLVFGRIPYVVTLHGTDVAVLEESWLGRFLARRVLRRAAGITAVSTYLADRIAAFAQIPTNRITVQPMPVDVARFDWHSHGGGGVVTVGRLTRQKNVGIVLDAIARLRDQGRRPPVRIIGDGPDRERLEHRVRGLDLADQVTFVGSVSPDRLPGAIGHADVMVFPAVGEGLGLVAAEALMLGIPVVATRAGGGVRDIVPPTGAGRLVPDGDAVAMASAIGEFLDSPDSRRLAAQTGAALRTRFAPSTVAGAFETIYRTALNRRG